MESNENLNIEIVETVLDTINNLKNNDGTYRENVFADDYKTSDGGIVTLSLKIPDIKSEAIDAVWFNEYIEDILSKVKSELEIKYVVKPNDEQVETLDKMGMQPLLYNGVMFYYKIEVENPKKVQVILDEDVSREYIKASIDENDDIIQEINGRVSEEVAEATEKLKQELELNINLCILV